jgi:hypothetical protein
MTGRPSPGDDASGATAALAVAGGALGRRASAAARSWSATVAPLLALSAAVMALGVVQRGHCVATGWNGADQFWHACFSDLPALYRLGNLHAGLSAYLGTSAETARLDHPLLTGAVMALLGGLVPDGPVLDQTRWYFSLWALLATVLVMAVVWLTAASLPRRPARAAHVALSPLLLLTALVSADILGVALAAAALWAWSRRWTVPAGVLLGLAIAARTYPVLILLALLLLGVRDGATARPVRAGLAAAGTVAAISLPFLLTNPAALTRPYAAWSRLDPGLGSVWMLPQLLGHPLPAAAGTTLAVAGWAVAGVAGAALAFVPGTRLRVAEVSLVLVAVVLVTGKTFPVQSSLWLLPLLALCGVRWRDHLVWAGAEALHFVAVWLYLAGLTAEDRGLPPQWYAAFLLMRVAAVLYLLWRVWGAAASRGGEQLPGGEVGAVDSDLRPGPSGRYPV